jgi:hypothetical protein
MLQTKLMIQKVSVKTQQSLQMQPMDFICLLYITG